ncbi:MAG: serine/threonine-protein phosphatase [Eubacteriales bacterium]|nr:serine/threonine-protein phosphatase [Eubacteriales bacterium]
MAYQIHAAGFSCRGLVRAKNEDNLYFNGQYLPVYHEDSMLFHCSLDARREAIFAIFDGLGGEQAGEVASYLAAQKLAELFQQGLYETNEISYIRELYRTLNRTVYNYAREHYFSSIGTTAAMLSVWRGRIYLSNLGDSRIFRFSKGTLQQVSSDHVLIDSAFSRPPLTQFLGIPESEFCPAPEIISEPFRKQTKYLLCSDGVTDLLSEPDIAEILSQGETLESSLLCIRDEVFLRGAIDNTTAILCEISAQEPQSLFQGLQLWRKKRI